jgi:ribosomal-protein-serine acetyltransferase
MAVELRHWQVQDAPALSRAVLESLDHLRPWMPWAADEPRSAEEREELIRGWERDRREGGDEVLGVFRDGQPVGGCGLHQRIGENGLELGYWIHAGHVRNGVATEVARQLCERAFADPSVDRVEIHHDRANVASGGVPAKLGFTHVSDTPRPPQAPAEEGVERVWRLTRSDYARTRAS